MNDKLVSAVIVSYNSQKHLKECINSLKRQRFSGNLEIIVIDNNSQDGSQKLLSKIPDIRFFPQNTNLGFSVANNIGLNIAKGQHILFINPDTKTLTGTIKQLVDSFNKSNDIAIVGCQMYWAVSKRQQRCCSTFPTPLTCIFEYTVLGKLWKENPISRNHWIADWNRKTFRYVDVIHGGAFMIKKEIAKQVGGFDKNYFLYFEETDLCKKVKNAGYLTAFNPKAEVVHYSGQSSKSIDKDKIETIFELSRKYYLKKHYGEIVMILVETFIHLDKITRRIIKKYITDPIMINFTAKSL